MFRKMIALALAAMLLVCGCALADTNYSDRDEMLTLTYDDALFEIALEDYASEDANADLVLILTGKNEAWGETDIEILRIQETIADADIAELEEALGIQTERGEWNGFENVISYSFEEENLTEATHIIQYDDTHTLTVSVLAESLEDEELLTQRDDAVSAVLDSLKLQAK